MRCINEDDLKCLPTYQIRCTGCVAVAAIQADEGSEAVDEFNGQGWRTDNDDALCPDCVASLEAEAESLGREDEQREEAP